MLWCSVQDIRRQKSALVMEALAKGWPGAQCCEGDPPDDGEPFAIYGQTWGAERLIPRALKTGRPFWQIDNGYWRPGRGRSDGYYRFCYRSMTPVYLPQANPSRAAKTGIKMMPWRKTGRHVLLAMPGGVFGTALGLSMAAWESTILDEIKTFTERPIVVRTRESKTLLARQLENCWALVTHSSAVVVDALIAGVPVFVAATSAAVPVGNLDLEVLERPAMPDNREVWWRSLMNQQFLPAEMADGTAFKHLSAVQALVDGPTASNGTFSLTASTLPIQN